MQPPPPPTRSNPVYGRNSSPSSSSVAYPTPSAASSTASLPLPHGRPPTQSHASAPAVSHALQGATLAFSKQKAAAVTATPDGVVRSPSRPARDQQRPEPPAMPKQRNNVASAAQTYDRNTGGAAVTRAAGTRNDGNGALLAATQAAASLASVKAAGDVGRAGSVSRHATGQSRSGPTDSGFAAGTPLRGDDGSNTLFLPSVGTPGRSPGGQPAASSSPSLIAATLAASRSASPTRGPLPYLDLDGVKPARARGQSVTSASRVNLLGSPSIERPGPGPGPAGAGADGLDTSSIPPTTSLVSLFESRQDKQDVDPVKKIASPRRPNGRGDVAEGAQRGDGSPVRPKPRPKPKPKHVPLSNINNSNNTGPKEDETLASSQLEEPMKKNDEPRSDGRGEQPRLEAHALAPSSLPQPVPDTPASSPGALGKPRPAAPKSRLPTSSPGTPAPSSQLKDESHGSENSHAPTPGARRLSQGSTSSNDTFVSASSVPTRPVSPVREEFKTPNRPRLLTQEPLIRSTPTPDVQRFPSPQASTPTLTLDSLTNAMVASNLAAARLSPNTQIQRPPVPPPRRTGRKPGTSSPIQPQRTGDSIRSQLTGGKAGMLQTLRDGGSLSDDEEERRRRQQHQQRRRDKMFRGNRKHAHHEGSRRRWRDEITPRERRRYEAVWASNRGLFLRPGWGLPYQPPEGRNGHGGVNHGDVNDDSDNDNDDGSWWSDQIEASRALPPAPEAELVVNVVVRDIWRRSRLPADELAEVWDLVDRDGRGALARDEFVVGMWLIDQRLRGRKIPARVSQSVWESAGASRGGGGGGGGEGTRISPGSPPPPPGRTERR
ncbi:hypothetical protein VTJ83DRAFT_877 [Remersonia thermophila]|uniref:EH domain-containing protein n=1 Tax=Remersonia thermophila TaxID=72144 RepID=A0ABR4DN72_9PEZI